ncbi:GNAT family N-acetyltransferase [Tepidibacter formicigenes]|jgi:ElaA protein|uniref:ElaA protein n=1 Tax=Tepidibacter formicigenes DSM 15518 TaxID=1123349 RepID=A0A1M6T8P8_9FIRM|nr:GNAT family N-acetyltransferase [Tepidibacter formicigenes]SHK53367.1 ElaA protein [Tepidibacter formicigenes DSM 15518]
MSWKIKKFEELNVEEIYEILKARNEVFVVEQECAYQDCDDKDKNAYHLFMKENDTISAYLRVLEKGISYDEISIGRVLVNKNYRKKGLARQMMLNAIDFIENKLNEKSIRISAQEYLINFYKSLGFEQVSDTYLEDDIPHVEMLYKK